MATVWNDGAGTWVGEAGETNISIFPFENDTSRARECASMWRLSREVA